MLEAIGVAIAGFGIFGLMGALDDKKPDNTNIGIAVLLIALGFFILSFV